VFMMLILPPASLAIRTPIKTGPKNWGHATGLPGNCELKNTGQATWNRSQTLPDEASVCSESCQEHTGIKEN